MAPLGPDLGGVLTVEEAVITAQEVVVTGVLRAASCGVPRPCCSKSAEAADLVHELLLCFRASRGLHPAGPARPEDRVQSAAAWRGGGGMTFVLRGWTEHAQ